MTVNQLIKKLQKLSDKQKKMQVLMASDSECNNLSPLSDIDTCEVAKEEEWHYEFVHNEDDQIVPNAVLLVPMN